MLRNMFKKKVNKRVLDYMSAREIADTKKKLKSELKASLYFYDESRFIVCAIADITEHGEPIVQKEMLVHVEELTVGLPD